MLILGMMRSHLKWFILFIAFAILVPVIVWPWSAQVLFPVQIIITVATIFLFIHALPLHRQRSIRYVFSIICVITIIIWALSIISPTIFRARPVTVVSAWGCISLYVIIDYTGTQAPETMILPGSFQMVPSLKARIKTSGWLELLKQGCSLGIPSPPQEFNKHVGQARVSGIYFLFPCWIFVTLSTFPFLFQFVVSKLSKQDRSLCAKCSYDLRGNESGVCPGCGMFIQATTTTTA